MCSGLDLRLKNSRIILVKDLRYQKEKMLHSFNFIYLYESQYEMVLKLFKYVNNLLAHSRTSFYDDDLKNMTTISNLHHTTTIPLSYNLHTKVILQP